MAITLTIAGTDRTSLLRRAPEADEPLNIDDQLNARSTAQFELVSTDGSYRPTVGNPVTITDGGTTVFAGTIETFEESRLDESTTAIRHIVMCVDYNQIADRRLVARSYEDQTAGAIFKNVVDNDLSGEGLTSSTANIDDGPTVTKRNFNYERASETFDYLSEISGFAWWIDYDKTIYFRQRDKIAAAFALSSTSHNFRRMKVERTREDYRNRQWFKGAQDVTATQSLEKPTPGPDGVSRVFITKYPVAATPTVAVDSSTTNQTVGVLDVDTGKEWYWQKGQSFVVQSTTATVLSSTASLEVTYDGLYPLAARVDNFPEQASRASVEGGSGIYERVQDFDVDKADTAIELANAVLRRYGVIPTKLHFETDTSGLRAGRLLTVNITEHNVSGAFLITRVRSVDIGRNDQTLRYEVEAVSGEVLLR